MRTPSVLVLCLGLLSVQNACKTQTESSAAREPVKPVEVQVLGKAIPVGAKPVALGELAKDPAPFMGKEVIVTGKVEAVCQHMGCWMTLKDANGEAFIRMAGHAFFIPKTASGRSARVHAKLVDLEQVKAGSSCAEGASKGPAACKEEAEKQTGKPLAKLELEATGVELQ
jgi:hypothetical protein